MNFTGQAIEKILKQVAARRLSSRKAFQRLKNLPYETLPFARIDHHRGIRKGFPEAVYAPGKSLPQLEKIIRSVKRSGQNLIVTRLEEETFRRLKKKISDLRYSGEARIGYLNGVSVGNLRRPGITILTGGTSDLPVAEEAAVTLELMGVRPIRIYDCGVAGLHRLLDQLPTLEKSSAILCVAGMEGALPSVVAGLTAKPVIAVPTSVGYGASFKGIAPLLTMLNSCSAGVAVVNIDNGYGAACFAASLVPVPQKGPKGACPQKVPVPKVKPK